MRIREPDVIARGGACAECGLRTAPDQLTCPEMRDAILARDFEQPVAYWRFHRLAIDAYCLQHGPYVKSAKSFAAHLCGMCVAFEHGNDAETLAVINRWLSSNPSIQKPDLPAFRGALTIAHVYGIEESIQYGRAVGEWAKSVWQAYADFQSLARAWIDVASRF